MDRSEAPADARAAERPIDDARADVCDDVLRRGFAAGVAEHGALALSFETFAQRATAATRERLARAGHDAQARGTASALERAALADLYLAVACDERIPGAWEQFARRFETKIVAIAVRRGASRAEAEQIAKDLPGQVFAPPADGAARTRVGTFDGSGSLVGWLAVIVGRGLADRRRAAARAPEAIDADLASRADDDPIDAAVGAETGIRFSDAMAEAWGSLTPREALALLLLHRDGLPQSQIARMFSVGEPRVSRIVAAASDKIRAAVVRRVGAPTPNDATWNALRHAVSDSLATLRAPSDPRCNG
jgi:RNA polymerase sigma factor (sigma-70 family)